MIDLKRYLTMKYIGTIAALLFAVLSTQAQSESESSEPPTVFGIKTGFNISQLSASFNSESKSRFGMHLGIYARIPMTEDAFFRPEISYSSQGQKNNYINPSTKRSEGETTMKLDYINIPIVLEYGKKFSFQIGAQLGILMSATEKGTVNSQTINDDLKYLLTLTDFGLLAGFSLSPGKHFNAGVRYNLGVSDIFNGDEDAGVTGFPAVRNKAVHFYAGYSF